ncbi:hypothetical protein IW261DRAFT_1515858 [Armillaria novae-zelandiae]|uniref:Uncharacterized protein n=1 Tax=Armillaria novae-zelandiae TaxID=153914 RepID=A0AA39U9I3_9AGAR|nr:hypothetical protein IW261DRAFT_1515858 [Armillaria novae-zelandiae]
MPVDAANHPLGSFEPLSLWQDAIPDSTIDSSSSIRSSSPSPLPDSRFYDLFTQDSLFSLGDSEPNTAFFSRTAHEISTNLKESLAGTTQKMLFGKGSILPTVVSASPPKVPSFSPSLPMEYRSTVKFGPTALEVGQNTRKANVSTPFSAGDESQRDEAIVVPLPDMYRQGPGSWHILDALQKKRQSGSLRCFPVIKCNG